MDLSQFTIFGIQLINTHHLGYLCFKLVIDLFFTLIIIRRIFFPIYRDTQYLFTTIVVNIVVFFICFFLANIQLEKGFAFGLFAVLSIVRYRTEQIPIRHMTYMFAVIIIAVLNALSGQSVSFAELLLANATITASIYVLEKNLFHNTCEVKTIKYEKIELIKPERYQDLLADLRERTGFAVQKAEIESINFFNNSVEIKIFYK